MDISFLFFLRKDGKRNDWIKKVRLRKSVAVGHKYKFQVFELLGQKENICIAKNPQIVLKSWKLYITRVNLNRLNNGQLKMKPIRIKYCLNLMKVNESPPCMHIIKMVTFQGETG